MGKPLNWMLSGVTAKKAASRALRSRLAATTILAVVPFLGYGRQAYAICDTTAAPDIECTGTITGDVLAFDNANVSTVAPFAVTNDGLVIVGDGHLQFTDDNGSSINNDDGTGLFVRSAGADPSTDPDTPGAVTIITDGTISGAANGIAAYNNDFGGSGDVTIIVTGQVTGVDVDEPVGDDAIGNDGIYARNFGDALTITTGAQSTVTGEHNAIDARNYGSGNLTITADGALTGNEYDAVFARNYGNDLNVTIGAQSVVDGAGNGIQAQNMGEGSLEITADGQVTGREYDGIRALNVSGYYPDNDPETEDSYFGHAVDLTITTGAQSNIFGDDNGIDARNRGTGNLDITADGYVTGDTNDGIYAVNHGIDLTITTGTESVVRGGGHGIGADNYGSGNLTIEANGWVGGYAYDTEDAEGIGDGINAFNSEDGGTLTITTGAASTVRGANDGIDAFNRGSGALSITANGAVTGDDGSGIWAYNAYGSTEDSTGEHSLTITTGPDSDVFGSKDGIDAINHGPGFLSINVNGSVTGQGEFHGPDQRNREGDGIFAKNYGTGLTIQTGSGSVVTGVGDDGIEAKQYGFGDLRITVNGSATGQGEDGSGIEAFHGGISNFAGDDQVPDVGTQAVPVFATYITVGAGGLAQGAFAGIRAGSGNFQKIFITNDGLVRNLSAESHDRAIVTWGGLTTIDNNSDLIGTVTLDGYYAFNDIMNNDGFWNMAGGTSDFGTGSEDTVNNTGTLLGADDPANIEHSIIRRLEVFNNLGGLISLVDGQEGDTMTLLAECEDQECEFPTLLEYTGTNGQLQVDTVLGQTPPDPDDLLSDELRISGNTNGTTTVHVNVVAATGANTEGIPVIRILDDGTSAEGHFDLDGPVNGGFFIWDMRYDAANNWHELYTVTTNPDGTGDPVLGVGALEIPAGFGAGQDIWFQTVGTLLQRQADLRSVLQGLNVTPVADYSEPVEPTPVATISPGFWFKGFATYIDRDDEENGIELDRKQTIYGGMAGFDFGTREVVGDALLFGIFGGYIASDLDFNATNTEWNYKGPTVGAYVTYLDQAFYADATVKVDFLDVDIDAEDLGGDDTDTDAVNIGARIDTGYKFGQAAYIEPQATLAVVHTEMDDLDIFGGTVEFDDDTSVRGRLGLRFGVDHTHDDATVYTADVTASVWENFTGGDSDVTIVDTGVPDFGASDDALSTYGDLSLGIGVANPDGWSTFVRGNYLFAEDYEAFAGNAGVRFVW